MARFSCVSCLLTILSMIVMGEYQQRISLTFLDYTKDGTLKYFGACYYEMCIIRLNNFILKLNLLN